MNAELKQLIRLQAIDLSIQEIRTRIELFPSISKALDAKLRSAQSALESAKDRTRDNQTHRKKLEGDVVAAEAKISKYRDQMMAVKTNEEYKAVQKEIEHAQLAIRQIEDEILNLMMDAEAAQGEVKAAETRLQQDQQRVQDERKELETVHLQDVPALESYEEERKEIEQLVSSDVLPRYERVRKHRGGIAVAPARDYVCEVCKVRIRPQIFQEIIKNDQLIACDACQRILYSPENLDHPFEVA